MANITIGHLNQALGLGVHRARADKERGQREPTDDLWIDVDQQDVIFNVTGEKISPNSEDGWLITDEYEQGYYDEWDDLNDG